MARATRPRLAAVPVDNAVAVKPEALPPAVQVEADASDILRSVTGGQTRRLSARMLRDLLSTVPVPQGLDEETRADAIGAASDLLASIEPRDAIEGALGTQFVALQAHALHTLRGAMSATPEIASMMRRDAARLMATAQKAVEAIERRRSGGGSVQRVIVERLLVQGDAIVGAVAAGAAASKG